MAMKRKLQKMLCMSCTLSMLLMSVSGCGNRAASQQSAPSDAAGSAGQEQEELVVFIAASLLNSMEQIQAEYEQSHPNVKILYNSGSSGTLQTQIEEGAECDMFFSAATTQMDALNDEGLIETDTITNLLQNKIVLIKPAGTQTSVTGFDNITSASSLALAGESVPVGQYARTLFENLGILDDVMKMEINEGANVTEVLTAVAEGSNEVGIVYATDAASMPDSVEIIAEATDDQVAPAVYPVGIVKNEQASEAHQEAVKEFFEYLTTDEVPRDIFQAAGFTFIP